MSCMQTTLEWTESTPPPPSTPQPLPAEVDERALPPRVEAAIWRGSELGRAAAVSVCSSSWPHLDAELPGGGWPCGSLTEVLVSQFSVVEFRLLAPVLAELTGSGRSVVVVGPAHAPHPPGLRHDGVNERHLVWVDVDAPRDRLWATEQLVKAGTCGAVIAWLPLVRAEQVRRLQVLSANCKGPVFLCRPEFAARDSSAAPLRVLARVETDWQISVQLLKRKGPPLEERLYLQSMPGGLSSIMTPRLRYPSRLRPQVAVPEFSDAVVSPVAAAVRQRSARQPS